MSSYLNPLPPLQEERENRVQQRKSKKEEKKERLRDLVLRGQVVPQGEEDPEAEGILVVQVEGDDEQWDYHREGYWRRVEGL